MSSLVVMFKHPAALFMLSALYISTTRGSGVMGVDGTPLSGSFDPTKCRLDRDDDQFKTNAIGGQCARCVTNDQCRHAYGGFGWYCCPFMKRCVNSGSMGCYDTALCNPRCFGEQYPQLKKECSGCDSSFPDNWVKGCTKNDWPQLVKGVGGPSPVPAPVPGPAPQTRDDKSPNGGGSTPDWCEWCLEDVLPSDRCLDYKTRLNWCAAGNARTMREQCSTTCGYCDGCPSGTAASNKRIKDSAPTRKPTAFTGVGKDCRQDRKFTGDTDFKTACQTWERMGYCDEHPVMMKRDCADTCGYCTHPDGGEAVRPSVTVHESEAESSESVELPERTPAPVKAPSVTRQEEPCGPCGEIGSDGRACQADARCQWDWTSMTCKALEGSCESIGTDGAACAANVSCEWSWEKNFCMDSEGSDGMIVSADLGKCQQIGSDGALCAADQDCRWDWDAFTCVPNESSSVFAPAPTKTKKGGRRGKSKSEIGFAATECGDAKNARACRMVGGCSFDKSLGLCKSNESARKERASKNPCSKLKGRRCTKNVACYLADGACLLKESKVKEAEPASSSSCDQLSRKQCKGSCKFDKALRKCVAA